MAGASIETTLELWASSLREVKRRIRSLFAQGRTAASAGLFIDGLLGEERRKTGWMRAEAAGDPGPWRQQELLGRDRWDADALRDLVRDYVIEQLAHDDAVLVIDETGFLKQGKASCGVARQYTGSAGKVTNCQIGVFAAYVSRHGHAFVDRALYLPRSWIDDPARLKATHVPSDISFATKPRLAAVMIERAIAAGARLPFTQDQISLRGAALECRIYAEDPANNFFPSPGRIMQLSAPAGPGVRVDSGIYPGWTVPLDYDPMLAKLIVWADTREHGVERMLRALDEYHVGGIKTNIPLFRLILNDPGFRRGELHTGYLDELLKNVQWDTAPPAELTRIAALIASRQSAGDTARPTMGTSSRWLAQGREDMLR